MLITHPGTTALNVVGWANATSMQSVTDILRGALYGGRSLAEMAIGRIQMLLSLLISLSLCSHYKNKKL